MTLSYDDDPAAALAAQLQAERQYRASLYVQHLDAAQTFLTQTLAGPGPAGLGNDYPFVAHALAAGSLLDDLAKSLDHWICPAVEDAMDRSMAVGPPNAPTTYTGWFDDDVFDPNNVTYQNNVTNFFVNYPITANALTQIAANFRNNLETACRRIIADKAPSPHSSPTATSASPGQLTAASTSLGNASASNLSVSSSVSMMSPRGLGPGSYSASSDGLVVGTVGYPSDAGKKCSAVAYGWSSATGYLYATGGNDVMWTNGDSSWMWIVGNTFVLPVSREAAFQVGVMQVNGADLPAPTSFAWVPSAPTPR